jgi:hypothetical protein
MPKREMIRTFFICRIMSALIFA